MRRALWGQGRCDQRSLQHASAWAPPTPRPRSLPKRLHVACSSQTQSQTEVAASTSGREHASLAQRPITMSTGEWGEELYFDWEYNSHICYRQKGESGPPILMLHGFGVGSWHFHRNWEDLQRDHRVWAVDLLGQGRSWPAQPVPGADSAAANATAATAAGAVDGDSSGSSSQKLFFSVDTWTRQLEAFLEQVVGEPAYVAGNSLGGYLAVMLAARRPDLVKGLTLLNATPFWAFRPPRTSAQARSWLWRALDRAVDGSVPVPNSLKRVIERYWWDTLRSPSTISAMLQLVYADKSPPDPPLIARIVEATQHPGALDAFTSIVLSPKGELSFDELLDRLACPVLLLYGKEDPWVRPLWGQRLKRRLPEALYLELSPAGHCPHHETPAAVNRALRAWVAAQEARPAAAAGADAGGGDGPVTVTVDAVAAPLQREPAEVVGSRMGLPLHSSWEVTEADGRRISISHIEGSPRSVAEQLDYAVWMWLGRALGAVGSSGSGSGSGRGSGSGSSGATA